MKKNKKRKISKKAVLLLILAILVIFSSLFSIYSLTLLSGVETLIRLVVSGIIAIFMIMLLGGFVNSMKKKKSKKYRIYAPFVIIYSILLIAVGYYVIKTYAVLDNFTTDSTTYSSSIVTLKSNKVDSVEKISGKVGITSKKENTNDNIVGYEIPKEVMKSEKINAKVKEYDTYIDLISALLDKEIDYAFLPTNYTIMFSNYEGKDFSQLADNTKIIYTKEKTVKNAKIKSSSTLSKPFTILLMGVDSEDEEIAGSSFNGDSLILITFNPENLNATILSIPRDTYVPITCFAGKAKSKITHAAWYGEECMMNTIENFTGINIDYFVKINFKGVVKVVDTLGGVEVDVPYSFCEQNSERKFGNDTVYVDAGLQTLNGEKALAFSRNRHTWPAYCGAKYSNYVSNDFIRGQNQQTVLKAILNKIKEKGNLQTIYKLLDVVSNSMETNMSTNEILSLYNVAKDVIAKSSGSNIDDIIGMQRLYLSGYGTTLYDKTMGMNLYNYILYQESLDDVVEAMKINLGQLEPELIKKFSFDIDEEYEEKVIGQMDSGKPISYANGATKKETKKTCSTNEEIGADGVSCVCKWGYTKVNGVCTKEEEKQDQTKKEEEPKVNENKEPETPKEEEPKIDNEEEQTVEITTD